MKAVRYTALGAFLLWGSGTYANVPMGGLAQDRLNSGARATVVATVPGDSTGEQFSSINPRVQSSPVTSVVSVAGPVPEAGSAPALAASDESAGAEQVGDMSVSTNPTVTEGENQSTAVEPAVNEAPPTLETTGTEIANEGAASEEYLRLFPEGELTATGEVAEPTSDGGYWVWPALLLVVLGAYFWRKRMDSDRDDRDEINIVGRASLGREGSLAVVVVGDADKASSRRLLIGYGGGAPRLVADLAELQAAEPTGPGNAGPSGSGNRGGGPVELSEDSRRNWDRAVEEASDVFGSRPSAVARKRAAQEDLIANVLADGEELRKSLGEIPAGTNRAGVRRRAYRGTMA